MLSLRLPEALDQRITQIATRLGVTRSAWLRALIEQGVAAAGPGADAHQHYLQAMADLPPHSGSGQGHLGQDHSRVLKAKLRARPRT